MASCSLIKCIFSLSFFFSLSLVIGYTEGKQTTYHLTASEFYSAPDGFRRLVKGFNNSIPAPLITAEHGDTLHIIVENHLFTDAIAIHWHGVEQLGTPWADGVESVTQSAVIPHANFTYTFNVTAGTYFYHAHGAMQQADGLVGALIVRDPNDFYRRWYVEEFLLMVTPWFHIPGNEVLARLQLYDYDAEIPSTVVVNGRANFNCTDDSTACYDVFSVAQHSGYRFRVINAAANGYLVISIDQHTMTIIEADSDLTQPFNTTTLTVYEGQRYSFIVNADQPVSNYWIRYTVVADGQTLNETLNILRYNGAPDVRPTTTRSTGASLDPRNLAPLEVDTVPPADINIELNVTSDPDYWYFNNQRFMHPPPPAALLQAYIAGNRYVADPGLSAEIIPFGKVVQLTVRSFAFYHPVHLHGFDAWVLGYGLGDTVNSSALNLVNPIKRDTYNVEENGWLVIRFKATNPGTWLFHCHVLTHAVFGMMKLFVVAPEMIPAPPATYSVVVPVGWITGSSPLDHPCPSTCPPSPTTPPPTPPPCSQSSSTAININFAGLLRGM